MPYNISTKILTSFLKTQNLKNRFGKFVFIFQKEVADRIIAEENSKKYGRLSIITSWKMDRLKIIDIDPKYFYPKPKVWSSLVLLTPKDEFKKLNKVNHLEHITNIFFSQRRKMIKKPMKQLFPNFEEVAKTLDIDPAKVINDPEKAEIFAQIMGYLFQRSTNDLHRRPWNRSDQKVRSQLDDHIGPNPVVVGSLLELLSLSSH